MRLSLNEKRLIFLALIGVFVLLGLALDKAEKSNVQRTESKSRELVQFPIDVNKAEYEELLFLPGIGPAKAKAIIEYREKYGPFMSLSDLTKVSGIGKATVEKLASFVRIEEEPFHNPIRSNKININTATIEQLCELPGIGEVKASEIIKFRQKNGPFKEVKDLLEVPGIGPKTLEKIKDLITF